MRSAELTKRNFKVVLRDPLSLGLTIVLPLVMLLALQALGSVEDTFTPTMLAPGIALFGFVMLMFSAAMILTRDRETALFARMLTAPLRANDFIAGYSLPYLPLAILQGLIVYAVAALLGVDFAGSVVLVIFILLLMAVLYIGLGMIAGALFSVKQVPFVYMVVLLLTIFGGAWMDLEEIGGAFQTVGDLFPFAHAVEAARAVMIDGAGLGDVAVDVYWILGYTLVTAVAAVAVFRRKMTE